MIQVVGEKRFINIDNKLKLRVKKGLDGKRTKEKVPALRQRSIREPGSTDRKVIVARPTLKSNFQRSDCQ